MHSIRRPIIDPKILIRCRPAQPLFPRVGDSASLATRQIMASEVARIGSCLSERVSLERMTSILSLQEIYIRDEVWKFLTRI